MRHREIEWLMECTSRWPRTRAKFLFHAESRPVRDEDGVVTAFRDGQVTLRENRRTEGFTFAILEHGYQGVRVGDLVLHSMDAFAGAIGVSESNGKCTPEYVVVNGLPDEVENRYYAYLLRQMALRDYIRVICPSVRERAPRFRYPRFQDVLLPAPPVEAQRAIADFLDHKTAAIDALIDKKERLLELLAEKRAALIHRAVTKGLDRDVPLKDSGVPGIGEIPAHWEVKPCRYLFRESTLKSASGRGLSLSVSQKRGVVPSSTMTSIVNPASNNIGHKLCRPGDLILNRLKAHLGVFFRTDFEGLVSPDYTVLRPLHGVESKFYEALFHHPAYIHAFRVRVRGIVEGLWRLYTDDFNAIMALVPPTLEQARLVAAVQDIEQSAARTERALAAQLRRLREYRQALITAAVAGQLDIPGAA